MNSIIIIIGPRFKIVHFHSALGQQVAPGQPAFAVVVDQLLEIIVDRVRKVPPLAVPVTFRRNSLLVLINLSLEPVENCGAVDVFIAHLVDEVLHRISHFFGLFHCTLIVLALVLNILELSVKIAAHAFDVLDLVFDVYEYLFKQ